MWLLDGEANIFGLVALGPFVGLWLLDQETDILSNTLDARWVGGYIYIYIYRVKSNSNL